MSCWSWPSWQCAAGGPWGHVGQACKLDAMLLLSSQGPFFTIQHEKQTSHKPSQLPLSSAGPQISKKTRDGSKKEGRRRKMAGPSFSTSLCCQSFYCLPSFPPYLIDTHQLLPALQVPLLILTHTHTHSASPCPCPYSPPVPSSLPTPVLLCTSAICTTCRAASHPASH